MNIIKYSVVFLLISVLLSACAGFTGRQYLVRSDEVRLMIEKNNAPEGHTYYYTGPEADPDAILGIAEDFTLQAKYWYMVHLTDDQLRSWNRKIANDRRIRYPYEGWRIMAPDGRQAGILYSKYDLISIKFPAPDTISITAPEPTGIQRSYFRSIIN